MDLIGKVALITGGAQGIGEACAWEFLARQGDVLLADINEDVLNATVQKMQEQYPERKILSFHLDVRHQQQCFSMADYALGEWGHIDILVNAAGIISPCPSLEVTQDDWVNLLSINLNGVFFSCQAVARHMQHSGGVIINLSSIASKAAWPGRVSYAAAKTGITGITESLAVEWASLGIRVNAVAPAWVNTEIFKYGVEQGVVAIENLNRAIPLGRIADVEDVSKLIAFSSYQMRRNLLPDRLFM